MGDSLEETEGISTLRGNPKKAILKLTGPMIIGLFFTSLYTLINAVWIARLGYDALAAIGFIAPILMVVAGFSAGIGAGASSVISRFIGEENKPKADNAALHVMILTVIFAVIVTAFSALFLRQTLEILGAWGATLDLALSYGNIILGGSIFMMFTVAAHGILLAEGNTKKVTYAMIFAAILNTAIDPFFIYFSGWGIAGAAMSTIVSLLVVSLIVLYWFRKSTYISFSLKFFNFSKDILKKILAVGIPAGGELFVLAILEAALIMILVSVSGTDAVAVYSLGWIILMMGIVPILALADSVIAVVGATFGAGKYEDLKTIQNYAYKLGIGMGIIIAIIVFIFAPYIAGLFTYYGDTGGLHGLITDFLRVMVIFLIFNPINYISSSIFMGLGRGVDSFVMTLICEIILIVMFAYILAVILGMGQQGVWWGMALGYILGGLIFLTWTKISIRRIIARNVVESKV